MTFEILLMLVLIVATLVIFALEIFPMEVTALSLLGILLVTGIVDAEHAVAGLSNPAVVTIGMLFVISHALSKTGLLEVAAGRLSDMVGPRKWLGVAILLITVTLSSGFLNNTAVVAMFIPLTIDLSRRLHISPSKVLLPLSYAAIVGGTLTLIGTSTNLIVNAFVINAGMRPLGMFEFTRLGGVYVLVGLIYVILFARRILPSKAVIDSLTQKYHMGTYLTELRVQENSPLVGKSCKEVGINLNYDITVLAIIRNDQRIVENIRNIPLVVGDTMIVRGVVDNIMRLRQEQGVSLLTDIKLGDDVLTTNEQVLAEGLITQTSRLINRTLRDLDFRRHYGAFVLAVRRHGSTLRKKIAHTPLQASDTLLMLAPKDRVNELRRSDDMIIISEAAYELHRGRSWWAVIAILPLLMILVSLGVIDILRGAMLAVVVLLLLRAVDIREAYRSVEWSVLMLIAAFVPVGYAMQVTGTAQFIASGILAFTDLWPPEVVPLVALSLLYLCTSLLTEVVSNNATALIVAPVAFSLAAVLGVDTRPYLIAVAFASSAAFMTPMSYQTNMMVYGPGSYGFRDYLRFGVAMNMGLWLLGSFLIPRLWPF
ncbi:MAG: SLC13 family permease [Fidelibacterota bacterium]|nr:MAG: SLC13 family permease [Candidatus Neomarinimicrobiota bacterium]